MINEQQLQAFAQLKTRIASVFQEHTQQDLPPIQDWRGQQIAAFQDDLRQTVGGYVSEKWFYTHLKASSVQKLPRIDMLNLLAAYVGAENWEAWTTTQQKEQAVESFKKTGTKRAAQLWLLVVGLLLVVGTMAVAALLKPNPTYQLCLVDQDDQKAISPVELRVQWLREGESPLQLEVAPTACVQLPEVALGTKLVLQIDAPYYQALTLTRVVQANMSTEQVALKKDDYALMIHYFSTNKTKDWQKRRTQLKHMLREDARIIQVQDGTGGGMAMYNRTEFINKMTLPVSSLKDINILHTVYEGNRIAEIRFTQKNKNK